MSFDMTDFVQAQLYYCVDVGGGGGEVVVGCAAFDCCIEALGDPSFGVSEFSCLAFMAITPMSPRAPIKAIASLGPAARLFIGCPSPYGGGRPMSCR